MHSVCALLAGLVRSARDSGCPAEGFLSVELGGSGAEYVLALNREKPLAEISSVPRADFDRPGLRRSLVAPGLVAGRRVLGAHHLGSLDFDAWGELGLAGDPELSMNDAEASALGEWILRGRPRGGLMYIGLGTGVGAAVARDGGFQQIEFSHRPCFGDAVCGGCGRTGCLDAEIGGHALPVPMTAPARLQNRRLGGVPRAGILTGRRRLRVRDITDRLPCVSTGIRGAPRAA